MSKIYDLLLKESSSNLKNNIIYYDILTGREYSFLDLFNIINDYIDKFKKNNYSNKNVAFFSVNNINAIAMFISFLELNINVDIYNGDKHFNFDEIKKLSKNYDILFRSDDLFISNDKFISHKLPYMLDSSAKKGKSKLRIATSGTTTGNSKLKSIDIDMLLENVKYLYEKNNDYINIYSYNNISTISGLFLNVFVPIVTGNKVFIDSELNNYRLFENIEKYKINKLILPRDVLKNIFVYYNKDYDVSSLKEILIGGEINVVEMIENLRFISPLLPDNIITSIYGSTETCGFIGKCLEKELEPVYVSIKNLIDNKLIYSYNKKDVFYKSSDRVIKINYNFNDKDFVALIPTAVKNDSIDLNEGYLEEKDVIRRIKCIKKNKVIDTNDFGIEVDNKIYVVGRDIDIIRKNNKNYPLVLIEKMLYNLTHHNIIIYEDNNTVRLAFTLAKSPDMNFYNQVVSDKMNAIKELNKEVLNNFIDIEFFIEQSDIPISKFSKKFERNRMKEKSFFEYIENDFMRKKQQKKKFKANKIKNVKIKNSNIEKKVVNKKEDLLYIYCENQNNIDKLVFNIENGKNFVFESDIRYGNNMYFLSKLAIDLGYSSIVLNDSLITPLGYRNSEDYDKLFMDIINKTKQSINENNKILVCLNCWDYYDVENYPFYQKVRYKKLIEFLSILSKKKVYDFVFDNKNYIIDTDYISIAYQGDLSLIRDNKDFNFSHNIYFDGLDNNYTNVWKHINYLFNNNIISLLEEHGFFLDKFADYITNELEDNITRLKINELIEPFLMMSFFDDDMVKNDPDFVKVRKKYNSI